MKLAAFAGLLALPFTVQAQKSISVGVSGGASLPMGDLADAVDMGYNVTGHLYYTRSTTKLGFRLDVPYDSWKGKGSGNGVDANLSTLGIVANGTFNFGESDAGMRPYLLAGVGMYRSKSSADINGVESSATSSDAGIQGGVGLSFKLAGFSTFLEAKYVNIFTEDPSTSFAPITFGIRF
jgi:hypothetical protein